MRHSSRKSFVFGGFLLAFLGFVQCKPKYVVDGDPGQSEFVDNAGTYGPYDTPVVCTSKTTTARSDRLRAVMYPGEPCVDCHDQERESPALWLGGTVYPTAHEPDTCNGSPGVRVQVTDANEVVYNLSTTRNGNFYLLKNRNPNFAMPYTVKVISSNGERVMKSASDNGDCNVCHSEAGTHAKDTELKDAPGRIMAP